MTKNELIDQTIAVLRKQGWRQNSFYDRVTGNMCLIGAMREAAVPGYYTLRMPHEANLTSAYFELVRELKRRIRQINVYLTVPDYNDQVDSVENVIALLESAYDRELVEA